MLLDGTSSVDYANNHVSIFLCGPSVVSIPTLISNTWLLRNLMIFMLGQKFQFLFFISLKDIVCVILANISINFLKLPISSTPVLTGHPGFVLYDSLLIFLPNGLSVPRPLNCLCDTSQHFTSLLSNTFPSFYGALGSFCQYNLPCVDPDPLICPFG